jgi:hypothetical protein
MVLGLAEVDEATDEQIEPSIIVVVEPDRARCPAQSGHSCMLGDVGESAIAVVAIENAASILRDVQIDLGAKESANAFPFGVPTPVTLSQPGPVCSAALILHGVTVPRGTVPQSVPNGMTYTESATSA